MSLPPQNPPTPKVHPAVEHWLKTAAICRAQLKNLPPLERPALVPLSPGDEWKEGSYRAAVEAESALQVQEAFAHCKSTGQWPTMTPTAAFFVADRLEWAARFAELLAMPPHADAATTAVPTFPMGSRRIDIVLWLAVDLYDRYRPLPRWCDQRSGDLYQ